MHALAHQRGRLARLDQEIGDVGAGDRRRHFDQLRRPHVLPLRLAVREPHGARDDEVEAALPRHALLDVVIAEEALQETSDEQRPLQPARRWPALRDAVRAENHQALYAVLLHRVDAVLRAAREIVGLLFDPAQRVRRRADDHGVVTGHCAAHRGCVMEVARDLRQRGVRDVELRGRARERGHRVALRER